MNKKKIEEYYLLTLIDIIEGIEVEELKEIIKEFEDEELYEQCAGMQKAIKAVSFMSINEIKKTINDKRTN